MANSIISSKLKIFNLLFAFTLAGALQTSASEFIPTERGAALAAQSVQMRGGAEVLGKGQARREFKLAHAYHAHTVYPYDEYCCHPSGYVVPAYGGYVAPHYGVGPASVRGVSRRTSRRTSRRVSRRR